MRYGMVMGAAVAACLATEAMAQTVDQVCDATKEAMQDSAASISSLSSMFSSYMLMVHRAAQVEGPDALKSQQDVIDHISPAAANTLQTSVETLEQHMSKLAGLCDWDVQAD